MMFSFNTCRFVLLVAATCAVTSTATQPVDLGGACDFAILTKTGITNVPTSTITGNVGASPIAVTAISIPPAEVNGTILGAADAAAAVSAMEAAYTEGNNRAATYAPNLGGGTIGGKTLYSGVYKFTSSITIDTDITLNAQGDPNAVFIITTTKALLLAAGKNVILAGDARADNIFWHVAGYVSLGANSHMEGNLLSYTKIDMLTGSSLTGRALAQTAVNLQMATIKETPLFCGTVVPDTALTAECSTN
jgi:hypothetical protein